WLSFRLGLRDSIFADGHCAAYGGKIVTEYGLSIGDGSHPLKAIFCREHPNNTWSFMMGVPFRIGGVTKRVRCGCNVCDIEGHGQGGCYE
ncbi:hypothetical protein, partial [Slackia piriformis]|uniref:hypothetical protein n=1 Tax=Slackia piriformis TaxID=626934 RepID=UPI0023F224F7